MYIRSIYNKVIHMNERLESFLLYLCHLIVMLLGCVGRDFNTLDLLSYCKDCEFGSVLYSHLIPHCAQILVHLKPFIFHFGQMEN